MVSLEFKRLALLAALAGMLLQVIDRRDAYLAQYQFTGTSGKVTLQLASGSTRTARLLQVLVNCPSEACTVTFTVGGGLATTTAATEYRLRSSTPATPEGQFFTASNASGGTALPAIALSQGSTALDAEDFEIKAGEAISITVTSSGSQTITVTPKWQEF